MPARIEDKALLTGAGRFIEDESVSGQLSMVVLRAPAAHGLISRLDAREAQGMPGVRLVLTAKELADHGIGHFASRARVTGVDGQPMREPPQPILADTKVVYVGQPVAAVVAQTLSQALDAVERMVFEFEELPLVADVMQAADGAAIWPDIPRNLSFEWVGGNPEQTQAAFDAADHVVELTVHHPRIAISPIETRGCLASFDQTSGQYTLVTPSQGVMSLQAALSAVLGAESERLRVMTHDVGGSFAVKIWPYPEQVLSLLAARLTGSPVKWVGTRSESFSSDIMGRGRIDHARLALSKAGEFLALQIDSTADMGAFLSAAAPAIVTEGSVRTMGHVYRIPGMSYRVQAYLTNKVPVDAYRGAGKPETVSTLERLIDVAAHELGIDRFALRERNLIPAQAFPYKTPFGVLYDAGNYPQVANRIRIESDWDRFSVRQQSSLLNGLLRGIGIGFYVHVTGGSTDERSEVRALSDGTILVRTGTQDSGQGHRTALAMIVAQALEVPIETVQVEQGDSLCLDKGGGTGGSNLMAIAGNTVYRTAKQLLRQAREIASEQLEAAPGDLRYGAGRFTIAGTDRCITLAQLAVEFEQFSPDQRSHEMGLGCLAQCDFDGVSATAPNGAFVFEVEVDPDTGGVRIDRITTVNDLGRVINQPATDGQLHGGIAQAIGEVLMEAACYDDHAQIINGSLLDYALPRAADLPLIHTSLASTESPNSELGVKGVGEVASIGAPGALMNAVHDALRGYGIKHLDMPLTSSKIWRAINAAPPKTHGVCDD
ncbi:MAG: xanthine dehydrogenase family protein molybdopterin-binding subunit [Burkholderiaceae bacterium]